MRDYEQEAELSRAGSEHRRPAPDPPIEQSAGSMQVRAAQHEDCHAIAVIHVQSWRAGYASLFPADYLASLSVPDREESWTSILASSASRTLVARRDGETLGFVSFGRCRDEGAGAHQGEVWALYVAPRAWSSGVGWALWEAARVRMLHQGFTEVSLWVLSGNARGLRFYNTAGFRREPHSQQFFERGGTKLAEVRLVFSAMSASPSIERTFSKAASRPLAVPHVIITGGPGAGKSTLLAELASLGYATVDESARSIIAERLARGESPRPNPLAFAREILRRDVEKYEQQPQSSQWVFFDRGVVESIAMIHAAAPLAGEELHAMLDAYRFHSLVFVLPPWEEIYVTDAERDHSFAHASRVHGQLVNWYSSCGYALHEVPRLPPLERARHVARVLSGRGA